MKTRRALNRIQLGLSTAASTTWMPRARRERWSQSEQMHLTVLKHKQPRENPRGELRNYVLKTNMSYINKHQNTQKTIVHQVFNDKYFLEPTKTTPPKGKKGKSHLRKASLYSSKSESSVCTVGHPSVASWRTQARYALASG